MPDLIAQGEHPEDTWRQPLPNDNVVVLGADIPGWSAPWERWLSHRHVELTWREGRLKVLRLPEAHNPVFYRGKDESSFEMRAGECFVIGHTRFTLGAAGLQGADDHGALLHSRTISPQELHALAFREAPHQIDVLSQLPRVIASATNDTELLGQLVNLLLTAIYRASAVALVRFDPAADRNAPVRVLEWDTRLAGDEFRPSHRLVREAIEGANATVLHVWASAEELANQPYTLQSNNTWAFCTPIRGEACKGWAIYVAGSAAADAGLLAPWANHALRDDLKFAELVAAIVGALRQTQVLRQQQTILSQFFSPVMLPVLTGADPEQALKPRETEVTVLFCDLRGFSRKVEAASNLFAVLQRVSQALGIASQSIFQHDGVLADFLGDAALAFWGWPLQQADKVQRACRTALEIRTEFQRFAQLKDHPLAGFQLGIGVATGTAVAGQIGTKDQAKVTVFGPLVNVASRLEGMTKLLRVPMLIDEVTAQVVRQTMPPSTVRCRRLAIVKPYGLEKPLTVSELMAPATGDPVLSDDHIAQYEQALDAFVAGDWAAAYDQLHHIPPGDRGKDVLLRFILQHDHTPPPGWNGVIEMTSKS